MENWERWEKPLNVVCRVWWVLRLFCVPWVAPALVLGALAYFIAVFLGHPF
ncbi:MAG: hypothetical protein WA001_00565 [Patescibacteria group bacterium]